MAIYTLEVGEAARHMSRCYGDQIFIENETAMITSNRRALLNSELHPDTKETSWQCC